MFNTSELQRSLFWVAQDPEPEYLRFALSPVVKLEKAEKEKRRQSFLAVVCFERLGPCSKSAGIAVVVGRTTSVIEGSNSNVDSAAGEVLLRGCKLLPPAGAAVIDVLEA